MLRLKENGIKWQCLRYDGDYSIVFTRYSSSKLKRCPSKKFSFKLEGDVGKMFQARIPDFGQNLVGVYGALNVF